MNKTFVASLLFKKSFSQVMSKKYYEQDIILYLPYSIIYSTYDRKSCDIFSIKTQTQLNALFFTFPLFTQFNWHLLFAYLLKTIRVGFFFLFFIFSTLIFRSFSQVNILTVHRTLSHNWSFVILINPSAKRKQK